VGDEPEETFMGSPLTVTRDAHTAEDLRHIASNLKDARQVRRVQAISLVMDGWSRAKVAAFACVDRQTLRERWLAKFGQVDKWSFCLRAASMPRIRSDHDETSPPDPRTGIQG
jgi:hypothetical protein